MADFVHRVDRTSALAALAEIRFGHLSDEDVADTLTAEVQNRDAPLQEVRIVPGPVADDVLAGLRRLVLAVMRRD